MKKIKVYSFDRGLTSIAIHNARIAYHGFSWIRTYCDIYIYDRVYDSLETYSKIMAVIQFMNSIQFLTNDYYDYLTDLAAKSEYKKLESIADYNCSELCKLY